MRFARLSLPLLSIAIASGQADFPASLARKFLGEQESKSGLNPGFTAEIGDISVIPKDYQVGEGDAFQIGIIGLPSHEFSATVDPNGNLFIADIGKISLGKAPLPEAIDIIKRSFRASLKNRYDVYVMLRKCKRPVVSVIGEVSSPGSYRMEGTQRLLDAVKMANRGQLPSSGDANLREVRCVNGDSARTYDLLRAMAIGDDSQNPYVYPGDRIEVRGIGNSIYVGGAVTGEIQGRVPLIPGETLADLMALLRFGSSADTGHVLHRKAGRTARIVPVSEAAGIALADNDVVTVQYLENSGTQDTVMVSGEAKRPGTYPIDLGKTTARDVIEFAGGATAAASMKRAFIIRAGKLIPPGATYLQSGANSTPLAPRYPTSGSPIVRPEISASLTDVAVNGDYAVIRFDDLSPDSVKLENGDELHIPRKEDFVYISGYVRSPGAYPYRAGEGLAHYIGLADGYTPKADKSNVVVMRYYNGIAQVRDAKSIEEGDVIVVPASVEFKRMTSVYLPLVQTMAAIASLVLTYVAVMRTR